MGHWILESAKVAMYIGLPLSSFVYFNSPSFYMPVLYESRKMNRKFYENDDRLRRQMELAADVVKAQHEIDDD